jgi:hypothetical protein
LRCGATVDGAHHGVANRTLAHEQPEVRGDGCLGDAVEERRNRQRRAAVRSFDERSDALAHVVVRRRHCENAVARVDVDVDEAGRDHLAASVHHLRRLDVDLRSDPHDSVAAHRDVTSICRSTAAIDHARILDEEVDGSCLRPRWICSAEQEHDCGQRRDELLIRARDRHWAPASKVLW